VGPSAPAGPGGARSRTSVGLRRNTGPLRGAGETSRTEGPYGTPAVAVAATGGNLWGWKGHREKDATPQPVHAGCDRRAWSVAASNARGQSRPVPKSSSSAAVRTCPAR
jgi:hypothetical protein